MMKKLFFALALSLGTFTAAQAQATFGIRAGGNLTNLEGDLRNESLFENKISYHAGVILNFPVIPNFVSIQPEILYSRKGFETSSEEYKDLLLQTRRREGSVHYNYIDVPVLANIKAGPLYLELGPQVGYLLNVHNDTQIYDGNGTRISNTRDVKSKEGLSEFEIGYAAGVGFASRNGMSLGLRYNGDFNDFVKNDVSFDGELANARHSVFMLTFGYRFNAGK